MKFSELFNFVPMLESRNVHNMKSKFRERHFCEIILADITIS